MNWRVMKTVCAAVVFSAWMTPALSQNYYLVIGAFSTDNDNVREFTSYLPSTSIDTSYTVQSDDNRMHFYVMKTSNPEIALAKGQQLQEQIGKSQAGPVAPEQLITNAEIKNENGTEVTTAVITDAVSDAGSSNSGIAPTTGGITPTKPAGKFFRFSIARNDGTNLSGELHQIDFEAGKEIGVFTTDENVDMLSTAREPMTVVCGVFGYKEVEKYIDFKDLARTAGAYVDDHGVWVIPYTLERLAKGDVSVMYNVSFYSNAVMMGPQSKLDLDELVNLMMSNPNYVIKIHAHCNGKKSREVLTFGADRNYFDVTGAVRVEASAKELTNLRAATIKSYLTDHGIAADRVKTYGWGGAEMLVLANDPNARLNDRVEIEILKD